MSSLHYVMNPGHDRDIRLFNWLLLPPFWSSVTCNVAVLEISDACDGVIGHWFRCPSSTDEILFLVAHRGNLRWAKHTAQTTPGEWKEWRTNIPVIYEHNSANGWEYLRTGAQFGDAEWRKCKQCVDFGKLVCHDVCVAGFPENDHLNPTSREEDLRNLPVLEEPLTDANELSIRRRNYEISRKLSPFSGCSMADLPFLTRPIPTQPLCPVVEDDANFLHGGWDGSEIPVDSGKFNEYLDPPAMTAQCSISQTDEYLREVRGLDITPSCSSRPPFVELGIAESFPDNHEPRDALSVADNTLDVEIREAIGSFCSSPGGNDVSDCMGLRTFEFPSESKTAGPSIGDTGLTVAVSDVAE